MDNALDNIFVPGSLNHPRVDKQLVEIQFLTQPFI
jgi:hypothetical protein